MGNKNEVNLEVSDPILPSRKKASDQRHLTGGGRFLSNEITGGRSC
uniref:Uncharacterized protein n=1 Tax=Anguilla anguilla TaxID=7936 RepID=A0A0E9XFJ1_ANGAN